MSASPESATPRFGILQVTIVCGQDCLKFAYQLLIVGYRSSSIEFVSYRRRFVIYPQACIGVEIDIVIEGKPLLCEVFAVPSYALRLGTKMFPSPHGTAVPVSRFGDALREGEVDPAHVFTKQVDAIRSSLRGIRLAGIEQGDPRYGDPVTLAYGPCNLQAWALAYGAGGRNRIGHSLEGRPKLVSPKRFASASGRVLG
jgi:hypothetical protein